jgi:GntR family transcriptional regulator
VDKDNPIPYYLQLKESLSEKIERGEWKPGEQLPSESELCQVLDVSRTVTRQALQEMEYAGLIVRKKGKGSFVAEPKISENLAQRLTGFYQDQAERGHPPVSQVLKQNVVPASSKVAASLNLESDTPVIEIERLRLVQEEPIVLVTSYLPYALCPGLMRVDLTRQSLYAVLEERYGLIITRGHRTLEAVAANRYEADLLQVEKGAPLMLLDSVSYLADGTPVEYYHALHRGDRSRFEAELIRVREQGEKKEVRGSPGELAMDRAL